MTVDSEQPALISRRQGVGCLALSVFSLLGAALIVFLGYRCMLTSGFFDCIGLLTIFPAAFVAIGLLSGAIGLQRFVAGRPHPGASLPGMESGWQPLNLRARSGLRPAGETRNGTNPGAEQPPPIDRGQSPTEDEET